MKHTTALAVVLMLAATAMPATVADYETPAPACPLVRSVDLRGLASLRLPSFDLALNPADAVRAEVSLDTAKACQDALGLAGPGACLVDAAVPRTDSLIGSSPIPRGHADFKVAAVVSHPCLDAETPYLLGGTTAGNLENPLIIHSDGVCVRRATALWEADVSWTADIVPVSYSGNFPIASNIAALDLSFNLPGLGNGGNLAGQALTGEGCEFVKVSLIAQGYKDAYQWANDQFTAMGAVPVHGKLGMVQKPSGWMVPLEGDGMGTLRVSYTLASDVSPVGTSQWDFDATFMGARTCWGAGLCVSGVVNSLGESNPAILS